MTVFRTGWWLVALLPVLVAGCVSSGYQTVSERRSHADKLATSVGWQSFDTTTKHFVIRGYAARDPMPGQVLSVFIEGDGLSWVRRGRPSDNPTPLEPVALKLAMEHPHLNTVYLARPCQYVAISNQQHCQPLYWTSGRYHEDVVSAMNEVLDQVRHKYQASGLELVGYSGGGSLAVLLAAHRHDVVRIITVAANLDHEAWTDMLAISPLRHSLNAVDVADRVNSIPQLHISGERDTTVPTQVMRRYQRALPHDSQARFEVIPDFAHDSCWSCIWRPLIEAVD